MRTRDLLESVLAGNPLTVDVVDTLLQRQVSEDTLLDYKVGDWLQCNEPQTRVGKPTLPKSRINQMVTGFANGEGGLLLVGIADDDAASKGAMPAGAKPVQPWTVQGCLKPRSREPISGPELVKWVFSVMEPYKTLLHSQPIVGYVAHPDGLILVIAVARNPDLIPLQEMKQTGYYLRFGDGTYWSPAYLEADLRLGRRMRPRISLLIDQSVQPIGQAKERVEILLRPHTRNDGFSWAEDIRVGFVGLGLFDAAGRFDDLGLEVKQATDVRESDGMVAVIRHAMHSEVVRGGYPRKGTEPHVPTTLWGAAPFEVRNGDVDCKFVVPAVEGVCIWQAAAFVVARSLPPQWYQVELRFKYSHDQGVMAAAEVNDPLRRMPATRPVVDWRVEVD